MKNLKTHILERLKISPTIHAQFTEELDELLSALGLDTAGNAHEMFNLSVYEDYKNAKNAIINWFNDNVSRGIEYYSPEKIEQYSIDNEDLRNKIIIDTDDFCGECDTSNVKALFYSEYLDIEESIDYTTLMIRHNGDDGYEGFALYIKAL